MTATGGEHPDSALLTVLCTTVRFPAPRWRLVAAAHERGLDVRTVDRLLRLPALVDTPEDLGDLLARSPGRIENAPPALPLTRAGTPPVPDQRTVSGGPPGPRPGHR